MTETDREAWSSAPSDEWPADWESLSRAQRLAWRRASPEERLRWLEEALTFALDAGALQRDRARRAAAARRWTEHGA